MVESKRTKQLFMIASVVMGWAGGMVLVVFPLALFIPALLEPLHPGVWWGVIGGGALGAIAVPVFQRRSMAVNEQWGRSVIWGTLDEREQQLQLMAYYLTFQFVSAAFLIASCIDFLQGRTMGHWFYLMMFAQWPTMYIVKYLAKEK